MAESGIHRCKSGHFHIYQPGVTPIWPFWSEKEAVEQVSFFRKMNFIEDEEAARLLEEIKRLTRVQPRASRGHFGKRLLPLRPNHGVDDQALVKDWVDFFNGKLSELAIIDRLPYVEGQPAPMLGPVTAPLLCDFIRREGDRAEPLPSLKEA